MAWAFAIAMPMVTAVSLYAKRRIAAVAPLLMLAGVLFTVSRSVPAGIALGLAALVLLTRLDRRVLAFVMVGVVAAGFLVLANPSIVPSYDEARADSADTRVRRLAILTDQVSAQPYQGLGLAALREQGIGGTDSSYSFYYASLGVPGLLAHIILMLTLLATVAVGLRSHSPPMRLVAAASIGGVLAALLGDFATNIFFVSAASKTFWIIAALGVAASESSVLRPERVRPRLPLRALLPVAGVVIGIAVSSFGSTHVAATYRLSSVSISQYLRIPKAPRVRREVPLEHRLRHRRQRADTERQPRLPRSSRAWRRARPADRERHTSRGAGHSRHRHQGDARVLPWPPSRAGCSPLWRADHLPHRAVLAGCARAGRRADRPAPPLAPTSAASGRGHRTRAAGTIGGAAPRRPGRLIVTSLSVVVPTRDRPEMLAACLGALGASLRAGDELIVVDSASADAGSVAAVVAAHGGRLVRCDEPGASRARNAGIGAAAHGVVAFVDDDVRVAPGWAAGMAAAFATDGVVFVTGRVDVPPEQADRQRLVALKTEVHPNPIDLETPAPLGASANLGVRRDALVAVGGFDELLGGGARLEAAEDLDLFDRLLAAGFRGRYEPEALAFHEQWRDRWALVRLDWRYGIGAGARLSKLARTDRPAPAPGRARGVLGRWPARARGAPSATSSASPPSPRWSDSAARSSAPHADWSRRSPTAASRRGVPGDDVVVGGCSDAGSAGDVGGVLGGLGRLVAGG